MDDGRVSTSTWTFARGTERIVIRSPDPARIVISGEGAVIRHIDFHAPEDRVAYQSELEAHLVREGWSLLSFTTTGAPPRRRRWLGWIRRSRMRLPADKPSES
jgi:hypothetical protein